MRVTIDSTSELVRIEVDGHIVPARRWEGATDSGIPVVAYLTRISPQTRHPGVEAQFAAELVAVRAPNDVTPGIGQPLDRTRVERLAENVMLTVRPELARQPPGRENVYVALNALAIAAAAIIAGAADEGRQFFDRALAENLVATREA